MNFRKINFGIAISFFLLALNLLAADAMVETNKLLPAGPKGALPWGFHAAGSRDTNLPSVLLIGDSVLNGYRSIVIKELQGKANVDVWLNPYHQATPGLNEQLRAILTTNGPYAVIHFNMGLHGWPKGRIPEGQFIPLTRKMAETIKQNSRGAQLIWASSTPVRSREHPHQLDPVINGNILQQNAMAAQVMAENKIPINDLYSLMIHHPDLAANDQFHWNSEGARLQGIAVAKVIEPYLKTAATQ